MKNKDIFTQGDPERTKTCFRYGTASTVYEAHMRKLIDFYMQRSIQE